jgi:hypothetical protein
MSEISVVAEPSAAGWKCDVEVRDGSLSNHQVSVSRAELQRFGRPGESPEALVRRSMAFLLEREPAGSILFAFELSVIPRYFPEYPEVIRGPG